MATTRIDKDYFELTGNRLSDTSFLRLFNILKDSDGEYYLNIFRFYSINEDVFSNIMNFSTYEINEDDWLELMSFFLYENMNLWWLILLANNALNPFEAFNIGQNVKIIKNKFIPQVVREMRAVSEE
jgi:hypothetical protein